MEPILFIPIILLVFLLVWVIANYNALTRLRNYCGESWAAIDTELKRRYDLIPNLVETVKGYARHEQETLVRLVEARNRAVASTGSPASQAKDENVLIGSIRGFFAVSERYPDLKANQNFLQLQAELANTEDRIQAARRFYNGNARDLNNRVEVFPSNLIASLFSFAKAEYFEIEDSGVRAPPQVKI
ncbi:MAG: LemA family protein [Planctomycetes bacterium]|nr:LemA family protein [Planctomycetota bacterium]